MSYAIFFDKNQMTVRLPVNPEDIKIKKPQAIEKYNVLGLGQIAKPNGSELNGYSFEAELPSKPYRYVVTGNDFKPADFYIQLFERWRAENEPVRLVISNGQNFDVSTLVLFENIEITESAGEEGDYNIAFELIEYKPFGIKEAIIISKSAYGPQLAQVNLVVRSGNPVNPRIYTVVSGDTLWSIAKRFLGNGAKYPELVKINPQIKNPALIQVGWQLKLPPNANPVGYAVTTKPKAKPV